MSGRSSRMLVVAVLATLTLAAFLALGAPTTATPVPAFDPTTEREVGMVGLSRGYRRDLSTETGALPGGRVSADSRVAAEPATTVQASEPWATVYVFLTSDGFDPEVMTVTVGTKVVWTNATTRSVTLSGEAFGSRIYLPLIAKAASAPSVASAMTDVSPASVAWVPGNIELAPGESVSLVFTQADLFEFELTQGGSGTGRVVVRSHTIDGAALAWATGPTGVLLRWRWPHTDPETGGAAPQPTGYNVYRDGVKINTTPITHVTNAAAAEEIMGTHWEWARATYPDVTTIAEFHTFLDGNPLAEMWLADQRYPIAQVRGLGYLDAAILPGNPGAHAYRVEALLSGLGTSVLGTITVTNQGLTPLTPPSGLAATEVVSDALRGSADWPEAQRNRQGHGRAYLIWDLPQPGPGHRAPDLWVTSYDVLRAGPVSPGQNPGGLPYTKLTTGDPVVPMADNKPTSPITTTPDAYNALPYDEVAFYYADTELTPCMTYAYKVAARDMLGQAAGVSTWITATVPDTMPPAPPEGMTTTVSHLGGTIAVTWQPAADAATYVVYRAETATAGWPGLAACNAVDCWITMTTTSSTTWVDGSATYETRYWYVVRAQDAPCGSHPPNVSAPSLAVSGILHDRVPPGAPTVRVDPEFPRIIILPDPDTSYSLLYCRFDADPTDSEIPERILIGEIPSTTTTFDVSAYYSASLPLSVTCWVQPVDANGNRGALTIADQAVSLCPSGDAYTLTTPTLDAILTEQGGTYGWTAVLTWTVDAVLPQLQGYRVYRQEGSGALLPIAGQVGGSLLAPDVMTYRDVEVKPGEVYTYVLAAVRKACGFEFPLEVRSGPKLYTIRPTLDTPNLDPCVRPTSDLTWDSYPTPIEGGIYMRVNHPYGDQHTMLMVVYRSLDEAGNYVAITPPFATLTGEYLDTDADRTGYWYVATVLNWATGEIVYRTPPATLLGPNNMAASSDAPAGFAATEPPIPETAQAVTTNLDASASERGLIATNLAVQASAEATAEVLAATAEVQEELPASADTTLSGASPTTPFGSDTTLTMSYASEVANGIDRALLRFDLSPLPPGSVINHAALSTYVRRFSVQPDGEPVDIGLRPVLSAWDEGTVTWNTAPSVGSGALTITLLNQTGWITWNVTELADGWWSSPSSNYGVALDSARTLDHQIILSSRENAITPPRLTVHYEAPPAVLHFGVVGDNLFDVEDITYAADSTPACLTGQGWVTLGGDGLGTHPRAVSFTCIHADYNSGIVTEGTATVALTSPIVIDYPDGFSYSVKSLSLSEATAGGEVDLTLPEGARFHYSGTPMNPIPLAGVEIRQNLTFQASRPWASGCAAPDPQFSFEMDPLPLKIVPTGGVTLTHSNVDVGMACTLYDERSSLSRPPLPLADANDGWLRPSFTAIRSTQITPAGVSGGYHTTAPVSYVTAMPYGFELTVTGGITFELQANRITDGEMRGLTLGLDYYQVPVGKVLTTTVGEVGSPTGRFDGFSDHVVIGEDGELFGPFLIGSPGNVGGAVSWANGGFRVGEEAYFLYISPVQTGPANSPSEAAVRAWDTNADIQAGLNVVAPGPDGIAFTWTCCTSNEPITFPDGVTADLYLRRGGVSDLVVATLTYPGLPTKLYNYDTMVTAFGISFCDNAIYDSDIAGDIDLPYPSDVVVPLVDMTLNPNTACATGGKVNTDKLTLAHWQIDLGPRRAEFRSRTRQAGDPPNWTSALWLLGTMDVPHVAPSGSAGQAPIPLESAYKYDGTFVAAKVVQDKVNYTFDGFRYLLSGVAFSDYPAPTNEPWIAGATLAAPPSLTGGFVELHGNLLAPSYGTVRGGSTGKPPDLYVLGWDPYVGFADTPTVSRTWTELSGLTWGFDLIYAQHHNTTLPRGALVGFRNDSIAIAELDQALVLASWTTTPQTDLLLGLSAGAGALRALAETTVPSLGALNTTLATSMTAWASQLSMSTGYVAFLQTTDGSKTIWSGYTGSLGYEATTEVIDAWAQNQDDKIPDTPVGGGTTGDLEKFGIELNKMRGTVAWSQDATTGDSHFEELRISLWLNIEEPTGVQKEPLVHADRLSFIVDRDGDYVIIGKGIKAKLYEYKLPKIDIFVGINVDKPTFEGNVAIYKLTIEGIVLEKAAAIVGVGQNLFYVGALIDNAHPEYSDSFKLGGAILLGRIDPASHVLQAGSFGNILKDIGATGGAVGGTLDGAYVRVYGTFPIYDYGCLFKVKAGGEIAAWYFARDTGCSAYGGRLRAHVTGKLLCVVSGRGDMTIQIYRKLVPGGCADSASFKGQFWAAGGIGFCDPDSWTSWASRWWGDSWCWTAGAMVSADYNETTPGSWTWDYDADYE